MSNLEILVENQTKILSQVLEELREIKNQSIKSGLTTCDTKEAAILIGVNNVRYVTFFHKQGFLNRRKGGSGFLYFKDECIRLAEMIRKKEVTLPTAKGLYE